MAFGPKYEGVGLVIKTAGDLPSLKKLYKEGVNLAGGCSSPKIPLYGGRWTDQQIRTLHRQCNCWVDLTRGEGFGLGQQAAAAMGNPVITTGWGAQTEVVSDTGVMRTFIDYSLVPMDTAMASLGVYQADQQWAEPSIEVMVDAMRRAAMERWSKSLAQANLIAAKYHLKRIGRDLAAALDRVKVAS
jgi:glycosyltransferase involved in cell wall biosynthesis